MDTLMIENDQSRLIERIKQWLGSTKEVVLIVEGDTLIVKRTESPTLESLITDAAPAPLHEIVQEVKSHRRERR